MWILYGILIILVVLIATLLFRAIFAKRKIENSAMVSPLTQEQNLEYANKLAEWIRCKTVSNRESYDDTEMKKLWAIQQKQFPHLFENAERLIFDEGCQILKIKGEDPSRNIMLMSHSDVVPAIGAWKYPPFDGVIAEESLWGRGTIDTKTPIFAEMMALEELLAQGFKPKVNVYIGSSHNEEILGTGIPTAVKYFEENNIHFELVSDEGGAVLEKPLAGVLSPFAMLAVHENGRRCLKLTSKIEYGHFGLSPKGDTPIVKMSKFIAEISETKPFIKRFYPTVVEMFKCFTPYMSFGMRFIFANFAFFKPLLLKILPKMSAQAGSMLGTTCYFTNITSATSVAQVQSKEVTATAFMRGVDFDDLNSDTETMKTIAAKYGIDVEIEFDEFPKPSTFGTAPFEIVKKTVNEVFDGVGVAPFILSAGSDARHLTKIADNVIRFAPITLSPEQFSSVHNPNEHITVKSVGEAVVFYKQLVKNYN
ncbi:MAG: M20/M25/M40 family metallo-hydrolase [Clostridia bacterium]